MTGDANPWPETNPFPIVLSAPSGTGKTTVAREIFKRFPRTGIPRSSVKDGCFDASATIASSSAGCDTAIGSAPPNQAGSSATRSTSRRFMYTVTESGAACGTARSAASSPIWRSACRIELVMPTNGSVSVPSRSKRTAAIKRIP